MINSAKMKFTRLSMLFASLTALLLVSGGGGGGGATTPNPNLSNVPSIAGTWEISSQIASNPCELNWTLTPFVDVSQSNSSLSVVGDLGNTWTGGFTNQSGSFRLTGNNSLGGGPRHSDEITGTWNENQATGQAKQTIDEGPARGCVVRIDFSASRR